jgi:hypothetical protein
MHWPRLPISAQAWHWPAQGESQHTESTQKPVLQVVAAEQPLPLSDLPTQIPVAQ